MIQDGGDQYITKFDEIRSHIDSLVNPSRSLKEPTGIDALKESLEDVYIHITPNGAQSGGGTGVQAEITEIQRHLSGMTGATIAAYKANFLGVLDDVVNDLYLLAANSAAALGAAKGAIMPAITTDLQSAGNAAEASNIDDEIDRNGSIGSGVQGPSGPMRGLTSRLADLLRDLSWETEFAEEQLRLTRADFQQQDQASADALRKHEEAINSNPYDPGDEYV